MTPVGTVSSSVLVDHEQFVLADAWSKVRSGPNGVAAVARCNKIRWVIVSGVTVKVIDNESVTLCASIPLQLTATPMTRMRAATKRIEQNQLVFIDLNTLGI
jgi:hypothetical protein